MLHYSPGLIVPYAELSVNGNSTPDTINVTKIQFTRFNTNGESFNAVPDKDEDHILISKSGCYHVSVSLGAQSNDADSIILDISCWKNNGVTQLVNTFIHKTFPGGQTGYGTLTVSGIHHFYNGDTLELWLKGNAERSIILSNVTMSAIWLGP